MKTEKNLVPQSLSALVPSREKVAFTLAEGATHVAPSKVCRRGGFTLAEVLITLAVVGVVAALTMPGLINHFRVQYLKSRFQKVDSVIQQAIKNSVREMGYNDITDFNCLSCGVVYTPLFVSELNEHFFKQFKNCKRIKSSEISQEQKRWYSILGEKISGLDHYFRSGEAYLLDDGALIGSFYPHINGVGNPSNFLELVIDTNGPYRGPNRVGHDIFRYRSFNLGTTGFSKYSYCNVLVSISSKTEGCYLYASANLNPIDSSKPYWDILYKPKSYWEKLQNSK